MDWHGGNYLQLLQPALQDYDVAGMLLSVQDLPPPSVDVSSLAATITETYKLTNPVLTLTLTLTLNWYH